MSVIPSQFELLSKTLEFTATNHRVISQNLANVNTPGFRTKEVRFQDNLLKALGSSQADIDDVEATIVESGGLPVQLNGNNVDIDQQMTDLDKNALLHQTYTQLLATKISMMRTAITGR